ncbi:MULTISPECIES: STAS domain-containing protein [unclassified Xanthobacter]|uniref:STAS domain-containing protein n=1 Tax=unclassified Xanthobacter TaxID=2623496 RepID=UPI001EDFDF6D|nr:MULTISPECIES: STAS domain-containing protein [unclassified Xanthobacter]
MKMDTSPLALDVVLIALEGRLDIAGAAAVEAAFAVEAGKARVVVVDLSQTPFIASIGIRLLLANAKALSRREGSMLLCGCDPQVERVLRSTGVDQLIAIVPTREAALAELGGGVAGGAG